MKKTFLLTAILLAAVAAQAKDHKIVVKAGSGYSGGHTEVYDNGTSDTLTVIPASNATNIQILIKDVEGKTQDSYTVPAMTDCQFTVTTPSQPDGYFLEVRDDREAVYTSYEAE